jgi:hypothetical protein
MSTESEAQTTPERADDLTALIGDMTACITTSHGYAQYLQRRIHRGSLDSSEDLLCHLAIIEHAAKVMGERLRTFEVNHREST